MKIYIFFLQASCPMDLTFFPMDSQLCMLQIESYGYTMSDLVYNWKNDIKAVEVNKKQRTNYLSVPTSFRLIQMYPLLSSMLLATGSAEN